MSATLFRNGVIFDGSSPDPIFGQDVLVEDGRITRIAEKISNKGADQTIELAGRTLMPGLIDAHYHAYGIDINFTRLEQMPMTYIAQHSRHLLEDSLLRGFTTVRDVGGADRGLWQAIEDGFVKGPRLFFGGRAFSQTGGHGDTNNPSFEPCSCAMMGNLAHVVDGEDALRKAVREELRRGANHIKVFVSGGIASPSDPIWMLQYSEAELAVIVDEARRKRVYVTAHAYTAETIERAVKVGIRSIEHANLITPEVAKIVAAHDAFVIPTLVVYESIARHGREAGAPDEMLEKLEVVRSKGLEAIKHCRTAGVKIGFGTDLLGTLHKYQLQEFDIRSAVDTPYQTLHSATAVNADLVGMTGKLGCVKEDALADLIVVDGNPLEDISLMAQEGGIQLVMKGGEIIRSSLQS